MDNFSIEEKRNLFAIFHKLPLQLQSSWGQSLTIHNIENDYSDILTKPIEEWTFEDAIYNSWKILHATDLEEKRKAFMNYYSFVKKKESEEYQNQIKSIFLLLTLLLSVDTSTLL